MGQQRERGSRRARQTPLDQQPPTAARTRADHAALPAFPRAVDQEPTARYEAHTAERDFAATEADEALPTLDQPGEPETQATRMLTRSTRAQRAAQESEPAAPELTQAARAIAPLKPDAERSRALAAINAAGDTSTTLIPGARRYRPPTVSVVPRRSGPRSAIMQFAVSMIVTAMLISALTLSTPLGKAAALDVNGPLHGYANAAPWIPTPTPTPKPKPISVYRPPAGANPGQQAVINEIQAVFGSYAPGALNVARCESGYDPNAWNSYPILNSHASGVFQILFPSTWNSTSYAGSSPFDANANIHAAYQIFARDGFSWREWQCQP